MKEYECMNCGKKFDRKSNYDRHMTKKNACDNLLKEISQVAKIDNNENSEILKLLGDNKNINAKTMKEHLDECKCIYCNKQYSTKGNVIYHIKHNCKKVKEIEDEKMKIFTKLKETKLKEIEEQNQKQKKKEFGDKNENYELKKRIRILEKELKKKQNIIIKNNNNCNTNSTINSNNNFVNNNQQNITLVGYQKENLDKIEKSEILAIMKRGFQAPVELTRTIHFNPKYPEYHNIFIPKINEKYGMVYVNGKWKIIDKNELVEDIYENKRDFIIQNLDNFINQLDENKKKSLKRWLDRDDDDESIKNTKNDIKMLLFDNRHMAMDRKKIMERQQREDAKKLEIAHIPKKIKNAPKVIEIESNSDSDSDSDSDNKSGGWDSDSTEYSNYSYVKSDDDKKIT
jgi:hypothetical protein